jgi:glycine hydroxymethyltransferase
MIPYDTRKALDPSGIRIGTPAATTRGMKEDEMRTIARVFKEAIINKDHEGKLKELKKEILELCQTFPIYKGK